jgi:hypothetical protein
MDPGKDPNRVGDAAVGTGVADGSRPATDQKAVMAAIVQDTYGTVDVLELRDIDRPQIADDEVLVRVRAAGVDRGVWHVMTGLPYPIRLEGYGLRAPKTPSTRALVWTSLRPSRRTSPSSRLRWSPSPA